jgi:lipid-binding SYLF domain-containing protein
MFIALFAARPARGCCRLFQGVPLLRPPAQRRQASPRLYLEFLPEEIAVQGCSQTNCNHPRRDGQRSGKDWKMKKAIAFICISFVFTGSAVAASSREDLQARIDAAKLVLDQVMAAGDSSIPMNILQQATCVGVVPGLIKGAFVFGAQYGQGVVTCRTGHGWSAPVFIRMAGGSWGLQIGGQSTDLVLIAVNDRGFQDLLKNKFKIGGDASAAAGPVGRTGTASTDWKMNAELLSYSRTKGLFAGIDLDGTSVSQNSDDTEVYFGAPHRFETILKGEVPVPPGAVPFVRDVAQNFVKAKNM